MSDIKISELHKSFGELEVLTDINLEIKSGEFVVFVGPSGCGKSTLLRVISGLEPQSSGTLQIGDTVVDDVAPSKRGIAMVFQSYALYPHMTVFNNMAYSLKLTREKKQTIRQKVEAVAKTLQLTDYLDRLPKELSGGQCQRVAIGRSIVRNPEVFLFDEPLSNLDAALRVQMRMEIVRLNKNLPDTTFIYVTHDQVEAMTMADRIVVMKDGIIQQIGTPTELYESPQSLFVAQFIGSPKMNVLTGEHAAAFNAQTVGVRPEHIEIAKENGVWTGKVIYSEHIGADTFVYVDMGQREPLVLRQIGNTAVSSGDTISFSPSGKQTYRFDKDGRSMGDKS